MFDKFSICLCGSGKKAKFCCSSGLVHELDAVIRMVDGDQRLAAIRELERLLAERPDTPCLLAIAGEAHLAMGHLEEAERLSKRFLEIRPDASFAHALSAMVSVANDELVTAVEHLQDAMDRLTENFIDGRTLRAFGTIGVAAFQGEEYEIAVGHLAAHMVLYGPRDEVAKRLYFRVFSDPSVSLLSKVLFSLDVPHRPVGDDEKMSEAIRLARGGEFRKAAVQLEEISKQHPQASEPLRCLAIVQAWLNRTIESRDTWRRLAELPNVDHELAVEAEAAAQLIGGEPISDLVPRIEVVFELDNAPAAAESLAGDRRYFEVAVQASEDDDGEPPPRNIFGVYNRALPARAPGDSEDDPADAEFNIHEMPLQLGVVLLYGKQTDRPARMILRMADADDLEQAESELKRTVGELRNRQVNDIDPGELWLSHALAPRFAIPAGASIPRIEQHRDELVRSVMLNDWPRRPTCSLDGRSPNDAAADFRLRLRLEGLLFRMEMDGARLFRGFDLNEVRRKLDLPTPPDIDLSSMDEESIRRLRTQQMHRVDPRTMSDDQLWNAFQRVWLVSDARALLRFTPEIIARDSIELPMDREELFVAMTQHCPTTQGVLDVIEKAQQFAKSHGRSPAQWLLRELDIRMHRGESAESERIFRLLAEKYGHEPAVREQLTSLLQSMGVLGEGGSVVPRAGRAEEGAAVGAGPQSSSGIWTPDQPSGPPSNEGGSKLWVPGMD